MLTRTEENKEIYVDSSSPNIYSQNSTVQFKSAQNFLYRYSGWIEKNNNTILDIGCGTGELTAWIAKTFNVSVCGIDISTDRICSATENYATNKISFFSENIIDLKNIQANGWKTIVSFNALHHIPEADQVKVFRNIRKLLTESGVALLLIPARSKELHDAFKEIIQQNNWQPCFIGFNLANVRSYQEGDYYSQLLQQSGFEFVDVITQNEISDSLDFLSMKNFLRGWLPHLSWLKQNQADDATQDELLDDIVTLYFAKMHTNLKEKAPVLLKQNRIIATASKQGLFNLPGVKSSNPIMTRIALPRDAERISDLCLSVHKNFLQQNFNIINPAKSYERWKERLKNNKILTLIAERQEKLLGVVAINLSSDKDYKNHKNSNQILYFMLDKKYASEAISTQLMISLAKHLTRNGINSIYFWANADDSLEIFNSGITGEKKIKKILSSKKDNLDIQISLAEFYIENLEKYLTQLQANYYQFKPVHILMPVYNSEKYLLNSIQSLLKQTWQNLKIILYNDGSTDNSINLLNDYLIKNNIAQEKIITRESNINNGVSNARKQLFRLSREYNPDAYIFWLDSDDECTDQFFIERVMAQMENTQADICLYNFSVAFEDEQQKNNSKTLMQDIKSDKILSDIFQAKDRVIQPTRMDNLMLFTSLGWTKCYAPSIDLPAAENCSYEDFVYMAALLRAKKITALPKDYMPIKYLRRSSSICGQRTHSTFATEIPKQLAKFFTTVSDDSIHDDNLIRAKKMRMAQMFVSNKISQYKNMLDNFVTNNTWSNINEKTQEAFNNSTKQLFAIIDEEISTHEVTLKPHTQRILSCMYG